MRPQVAYSGIPTHEQECSLVPCGRDQRDISPTVVPHAMKRMSNVVLDLGHGARDYAHGSGYEAGLAAGVALVGKIGCSLMSKS